MPPKGLVVACVVLLMVCGVAGTLVAAAAIVEFLSTARQPQLLVGAVGAFFFGVGAITTAVLCARLGFAAVFTR